jgi:hypothetical protein
LLAAPAAAVCSVLLLAGCGSSDTHASPNRKPSEAPQRVGSTRGSAVALSRDERIAVVANRSAGVVTILELDPQNPTATVVAKHEIDVDAASIHDANRPSAEPWAAVIGADDDTAYVIARADQMVLRISRLRTNPRIDAAVPVGSEPTGLAISPSGARLFVANFGEGTISIVATADFGDVEATTLSLNTTLAASGFLGNVPPRAALAHPRALAMTDDGDASDAGETLYATEFFSQPIPGTEDPSDLTQPDRNRQGVVYPVPLAANTVVGEPITIPPIATGFVDSKGNPTMCIPNQLYAAAASGGQVFVTSMCASPRGPLGPDTNADMTTNTNNFKTLIHPSVFVIDRVSNEAQNDRAIVLTHELDARYAADAETNQRMPLIPGDLDVAVSKDDPRTRRACMTGMGADAVFCLSIDEDGKLLDIGEQGARYVDLHDSPPEGRSGKRPVGIALSRSNDTQFALAANDGMQNLSAVDVRSNRVVNLVPLTDAFPTKKALVDDPATLGRNVFSTGLTLWSFQGQAWCSCESCHPDGLSDGLTWFFSRGPRRTISTAGTFGGGQQRLMLWTASIDEVHDVEAIVRGVSGGLGGMLWTYPGSLPPGKTFRILYAGESVPATQNARTSTFRRDNLNGSLKELLSDGTSCSDDTHCDHALSNDWDNIEAYIAHLRKPRRPTTELGGNPENGRQIFEQERCNGCHAGPAWTLSKVFYTPGEDTGGAMPFTQPSSFDPSMVGTLRATTYQVPDALRALNPPARASGSAQVRTYQNPPSDQLPGNLYTSASGAGDQINCALRDVGTFPAQTQDGTPNVGVAPPDAPVVRELRQDMQKTAMGATGFNIPSLVGLGMGAPYFHAGNARTLEEAFATTFVKHYTALASDDVLSPRAIQDLVAFLLTIDDSTTPEAVPADQPYDLCGTVDLR